MKVTLEGDPQEIMTLLASLASNPHVISQTEQLPSEPEKPVVVEQKQLPQVRQRQRPQRPIGERTMKERVMAYVAEHPGQTLGQISKGLGVDGKSISGRLRDLCVEKRIERVAAEGEQIGTYSPIGDYTPEGDGRPAIMLPGPQKQIEREQSSAERTGLKWEILDLLRTQGPMRVDRLRQNIEASGRTNLTSNNLYARLAELHEDGYVARIPDASGKFIYRFLKNPEKAKTS